MKKTLSPFILCLVYGIFHGHVVGQELTLSLSSFENGFLDRFAFTVTNSSNGGSAAYVAKAVGLSTGLVTHDANQGTLRLDTRLAAGRRESIRINSRDRFTKGVFVFDLGHVPRECGAWPSIWLVSRNFDEIDIFENINLRSGYVNFHTAARGCRSRNNQAGQSAKILGTVCSLGEASPGALKGCIQGLSEPVLDVSRVDGKLVVSLGGDSVRVYYARHGTAADGYLNDRLSTGGLVWADLSRLALLPVVDFAFPDCTTDMFRDMQLVINTNFCGGWTQGDFGNGCSAAVGTTSCRDHVLRTTMNSSFWQFRSIRFYSEAGSAARNEVVAGGNAVRTGLGLWMSIWMSIWSCLYFTAIVV